MLVVSQMNKNVLSISNANAEKHNGMYECMATNDFGTQTSIAQIRVLCKSNCVTSLFG